MFNGDAVGLDEFTEQLKSLLRHIDSNEDERSEVYFLAQRLLDERDAKGVEGEVEVFDGRVGDGLGDVAYG